MWWKIYFWIILLISFGTYLYIASTNSPKMGDLIELVIAVVSIIGLYSYVYKKATFNKSFWKIFFWVFLLSGIFFAFYQYTPLNNLIPYTEVFTTFNEDMTTLIQDLMFTILFSPLIFPNFYAIYKLGNNK